MRFRNVATLTAPAFLLFLWNLGAQEKPDREVEIYRNVKLIIMSAGPDIPEAITTQYRNFLPILEEALKETTTAQSDECALTVRVSAGIREIGAAKTQRAQARITAFRRNSKQEYFGSFILYSYVTGGPVNKEETAQFIKKQILDPAECRKAE